MKIADIKSNETGFTIIELMIVLATAGLILLIVFEALPALERSGRNNQRRQDVQTILEAVSHWELANSANFPAPCGDTSMDPCNAPPATPTVINPLYYVKSKLTYYTDTDQVVIHEQQNANSGASDYIHDQGPETSTETVDVYNYELCDTNTQGKAITGGPTGVTAGGAGYSNVVALYALETGSGPPAPQCQQL